MNAPPVGSQPVKKIRGGGWKGSASIREEPHPAAGQTRMSSWGCGGSLEHMTEAAAPAKTPVSAVMHRGIVNCPPQTPVREVAAEMAENGVHCIVVEGLARGAEGAERLVWGIVSDMDLMAAAAGGRLDAEVGDLAATEIVTVDADESVERAIQLMCEHEISHLVVVTPLAGEPAGVFSTLDAAGFIASLAEASEAAAAPRGSRETAETAGDRDRRAAA